MKVWLLIGAVFWLFTMWHWRAWRNGFSIVLGLVIAFDFLLLGPLSIIPVIICLAALPRPGRD